MNHYLIIIWGIVEIVRQANTPQQIARLRDKEIPTPLGSAPRTHERTFKVMVAGSPATITACVQGNRGHRDSANYLNNKELTRRIEQWIARTAKQQPTATEPAP